MKKKPVKIDQPITVFLAALMLVLTGLFTSIVHAADLKLPKMRYVLPLKIDWPILKDPEYFSFKGINAASLTLRRLQQINCQYLERSIHNFPHTIFRDIGLIILVQKSLEGALIHTYDHQLKEDLVLAEMSKLIRKIGQYQEALTLLDQRLPLKKRLPSLMTLCKILEIEKRDLLRQKYHYDQTKWNLDLLDVLFDEQVGEAQGDA